MSASLHNTWEGNGDDEDPRRPSTEDLGGDEKEDDAEYPPDDVEHPTAAGWNQKVKQIVAISRVTDVARLHVTFSGGTPSVNRVTAPSGNVTTATFDVTDEGTGVTLIEWNAGTFPPEEMAPHALTLLSSGTSRLEGHVDDSVTNGVRVYTFSNGTAADVNFVLALG
jgi:hypothetical protein